MLVEKVIREAAPGLSNQPTVRLGVQEIAIYMLLWLVSPYLLVSKQPKKRLLSVKVM